MLLILYFSSAQPPFSSTSPHNGEVEKAIIQEIRLGRQANCKFTVDVIKGTARIV